MSMVTDVTKKIILAGLGTIDEQNEEIKDLLRRGSEVLGLGNVDNEELLYNGNREEIMRKREERKREDNSLDLGDGKSLYFNEVKDEDGKVIERNLELSKTPVYGTKEVSVEAIKEDDGRKAISIHTAEGGAEDDQN
ncbi:MAG: hypothetical protein J5625_01675 [Lachnospiraceae bacterium]|nr:hypothetical protein [Lachnospiraceae bacterium]